VKAVLNLCPTRWRPPLSQIELDHYPDHLRREAEAATKNPLVHRHQLGHKSIDTANWKIPSPAPSI